MDIQSVVINHDFGRLRQVFAYFPVYFFPAVRADGVAQLALNYNNDRFAVCVPELVYNVCDERIFCQAAICCAMDVLHLKINIWSESFFSKNYC